MNHEYLISEQEFQEAAEWMDAYRLAGCLVYHLFMEGESINEISYLLGCPERWTEEQIRIRSIEKTASLPSLKHKNYDDFHQVILKEMGLQ